MTGSAAISPHTDTGFPVARATSTTRLMEWRTAGWQES